MRFVRVSVFAASMGLCIAGWSQQSAPAAMPAGTSATATAAPAQGDAKDELRQRATAYYTALIHGDGNIAQQFLTPESREQFDISRSKTLAGFTVDQVTVDGSGEKADVAVTRSFGGPFGMSVAWHDQWVNVGGQWLMALPKRTGETPFGDFGPPKTNAAPKDPQAEAQAIQRMTERQSRTVDPDQYMKQLDRYVKEHPESLAPEEIQVPMPQTQVSQGSQAGPKAATGAKSTPANADQGQDHKNDKKKKKSKKTPGSSDKAQPETTPKS